MGWWSSAARWILRGVTSLAVVSGATFALLEWGPGCVRRPLRRCLFRGALSTLRLFARGSPAHVDPSLVIVDEECAIGMNLSSSLSSEGVRWEPVCMHEHHQPFQWRDGIVLPLYTLIRSHRESLTRDANSCLRFLFFGAWLQRKALSWSRLKTMKPEWIRGRMSRAMEVFVTSSPPELTTACIEEKILVPRLSVDSFYVRGLVSSRDPESCPLIPFESTKLFPSPRTGSIYRLCEPSSPDLHEDDRDWMNNHGRKLILFIHGGGYIAGSAESYQFFTEYICKETGMDVLSLDYPLAPEASIRSLVELVIATLAWLVFEKGYQMSEIALCGDSAGGGLCCLVCQELQNRLQSRKLPNLHQPACVVLFSPWMDLSKGPPSRRLRSEADPLLGPGFGDVKCRLIEEDEHPLDSRYSPAFGSFHGFPPVLVQVGSEEILLDDSLVSYQRMIDDGVDAHIELWDGLFHCFQLWFNYFDEARVAVRDACTFMSSNTTVSQDSSIEMDDSLTYVNVGDECSGAHSSSGDSKSDDCEWDFDVSSIHEDDIPVSSLCSSGAIAL